MRRDETRLDETGPDKTRWGIVTMETEIVNLASCRVTVPTAKLIVCAKSVCGCQRSCPKRRESQDRVDEIRKIAVDVRSRRR